MKKLKLFVWEGALTDYTSGIVFALAKDVEEARKLIREKDGTGSKYLEKDLEHEPLVITKPEGFVVWGGG